MSTKSDTIKGLLNGYKSGDYSNPYEMARLLSEAFDGGYSAGRAERDALKAEVERLKERDLQAHAAFRAQGAEIDKRRTDYRAEVDALRAQLAAAVEALAEGHERLAWWKGADGWSADDDDAVAGLDAALAALKEKP